MPAIFAAALLSSDKSIDQYRGAPCLNKVFNSAVVTVFAFMLAILNHSIF